MKKLIVSLAVAFTPFMALAQVTTNRVTDVNSLSYKLTGIGNTIIVILIAVAVIFIVYNILMFIMKAGTEDRKTYQGGILWGIVGLAVILSIWGLVAILTNTFGTSGAQGPTTQYPQNLPPPVVQ